MDQQVEQKVIIFDWDDTICPSSFVDRCNIDHVSELPVPVRCLLVEEERYMTQCAERYSQRKSYCRSR
jgi:hypothetical protein